MSMTFVYTVNRQDRTVSVVTTGELDAAVAGPFGTALCRLAEAGPTDQIEVDLAGLRFIDSTGTAALKRAHRSTARLDCTLVVVHATGLVRRVLELTGTLPQLAPHADLAPRAD